MQHGCTLDVSKGRIISCEAEQIVVCVCVFLLGPAIVRYEPRRTLGGLSGQLDKQLSVGCRHARGTKGSMPTAIT